MADKVTEPLAKRLRRNTRLLNCARLGAALFTLWLLFPEAASSGLWLAPVLLANVAVWTIALSDPRRTASAACIELACYAAVAAATGFLWSPFVPFLALSGIALSVQLGAPSARKASVEEHFCALERGAFEAADTADGRRIAG